jgi:hypothetical protein
MPGFYFLCFLVIALPFRAGDKILHSKPGFCPTTHLPKAGQQILSHAPPFRAV